MRALHTLRLGGVIIFPTETAYAIGCDATNAAAVRRIYRIKGREHGKPLPVIVSDLRQARRFFTIEGAALTLARRYWPGPLTIVIPARDRRLRRAIGPMVGVRVSSDRVARALALGLGRPIVATSANRSGQPTCYSVRSVLRGLPRAAFDAVIDAGSLPRKKPSTVVKIVRDRIVVLRRGSIREAAIR